MQDLAKDIKEMWVDKMRKSPKRFQLGESSDMSHHGTGQPVDLPPAPQASKCSTMPTFLVVENEGPHDKASIEEYFVEYDSQSQKFKDNLSFQDFCHIKNRRRPGLQYRDGGFFHSIHHTMGRLFFPKFDGSSSNSAKESVEKLDIYFQLNKVSETKSIKITTLHFEGEAHNWWFHGLSTLGPINVNTYAKFTRRLVERFDRKGS